MRAWAGFLSLFPGAYAGQLQGRHSLRGDRQHTGRLGAGGGTCQLLQMAFGQCRVEHEQKCVWCVYMCK